MIRRAWVAIRVLFGRLGVPGILLTVCGFLIPIIGGQIAIEPQSLEPGYNPAVKSLFLGVEIPTLQHALLALLVIGSLGYLVLKRKILQVPHAWVGGPLSALLALLIGSVFMSNYRWTSITGLAEWAVYGISVLAVVGGLGRKLGPVAVLSALSAGCGLVGFLGIVEFAQAHNPTWRIFGGWNNPNALAGMMVVGVLVSLGLVAFAFRNESKADFNPGLVGLGGICAVLSGIALLLSGSKGGLLSLVIGCLVLAVLLWGWRKPAAILVVVGVLAVMGVAIVSIQKSAGVSQLRVTNASESQEQSAGFRIQLWKGALELVKDDPIGRGIDTYANYSAMPGTNTRTELAHSTWLQLGVEAGILAPLALLAMLLAWLVLTFRSARSLPRDLNALRASVVAAVVAVVADGFIESNLYFFGIGLAFFLLLGIGIQLSADAGAPEFVAAPVRIGAVVVAACVVSVLLFAGYVEKLQANVVWLATNGQLADARDTQATLRSIAPFDGDAWYYSGWLASSVDEALHDYQEAAQVAPSPKYLRRLAAVQAGVNQPAQAEISLRKALEYDPNNLTTLVQLMQLQDSAGEQADAQATARSLIAVEKTPYFQIRAIAEIVPTETYDARIYLAKTAPNKIELLRGAVEGLLVFARTTAPYVRAMTAPPGGLPSVGGLTMDDVNKEVGKGLAAAKQLEAIYRATGDKTMAAWAGKAAAEFEGSLSYESK